LTTGQQRRCHAEARIEGVVWILLDTSASGRHHAVPSSGGRTLI
jgi:hypothetical protein